MPEAGWYEDPHNPDQQRYWDGETWTEHTHDAPFHTPQAPGQGTDPALAMPSGPPGHINDIGEWLGRSFRVLFANAMPLFILLLLSLVPTALALLAAGGAIADVVITVDDLDSDNPDFSFEGVNGGLIALAGLVAVAAPLAAAVFSLAQSYVLHRGHLGQSVGLGEALSAGLRGLPRYVGWWIAIALGIFGLIVILAILFIVLAAVAGPLAGLVILVAVLGVIPAVLYFIVKTGFLAVSCAVAPKGMSALRASTERSVGRFFPVLGRIVLLAIIGFLVSLVVQGIASPGFLAGFSVDSAGQPTIDGVPIDELEEIRLGDLLPLGGSILVASLIAGLLNGVVSLYNRSGVAGLYRDTDGPTDPVEAPATV